MGNECTFRIVEASRGTDGIALISEKQAEKLIEDVREVAQKRVSDGVDIDDAIVDILAERSINARKESEIQKRNALANIIKRNELVNRAVSYVDSGLTVRKSMQATLVGIQGLHNKGRASVDNKIKTVTQQYLGEFEKQIEGAGLLKALRSKKFDADIEEELFQLSREKKGFATKSKEAQQIASIFHEISESLRLRQNEAGAQISKLDDYSVSQTHNRMKMRSMGEEAWKEKISPLLDNDRTFKGADKDKFLKSVYEVLTTGISRKKLQDGNKLFEFKGPSNLAKKVSQERVLHFKDAAASRAYRMELGTQDLSDGIAQHITTAARNIGLMESLGTNHKAMLDTVLAQVNDKYRSDLKKVASANDIKVIDNFYSELDLSNSIPSNPTAAKIGSGIRMLQGMASLGGATISSITDLPVKAIELQGVGKGVFESYKIAVADIVKAVGGNNQTRRNLARSIRAGSDAMSGAVIARFSSTDDLPGAMSRLQRQFFKLNLMTWWNDAQKDGTGIALANHLALQKDVAYDALDEDILRHFNNFGITKDDWDVIKTASQDIEGEVYLTPDSMRALDLPAKRKQDLEDKLRGFYIDIIDTATLTPDAREQAILTQGTQRGTATGELLRFMMQFKSFPTTVISKLFGRAFHAKGKTDVPMLIQSTLAMTALGYAAMSAKDLLKGKEPRPLSDPKTWAASYVQGGGAGLLGDFFFGEFSRFGQTVTTTLAGPTFGDLDALGRIFMEAKSGDGKDTLSKSTKLLIDNTPFANLFYLRPALNYLMLYQLQEALNPGSLRRMERRLEKQENRKYLVKPSSVL